MTSLIVILGVCFLSAAAGSVFTNHSIKTWYPTIKKPKWNPPNFIFAPVWTVLYVMMAIAGWIVYEKIPYDSVSLPMILFIIQLGLNVAWSMIFFALRSPGWAVVEVVVLWVSIGVTMFVFWGISPLAGGLFMPYFLWVSFAAYLNYTIWRLNR